MDDLAKIKEIEAEIAKQILSAKEKGEKDIESAKSKRKHMIEKELENARAVAKKNHDKLDETIDADLQRIRTDLEKKLSDLERGRKKNRRSAIDLVLDEIGV